MTIVSLLLAGCAASTASSPAGLDPQRAGLLVVPAEQRPVAPRTAGPTVDGRNYDLAEARGQIVVLNFFASWCPPCLEELPVLAAADRDLPGLQVVGLDVADYAEAANGVLTAVDANYPAFRDPDGSLAEAFTGRRTPGLPMSILLDEQGRVAGRILGPVTMPMLQEAVARIRST